MNITESAYALTMDEALSEARKQFAMTEVVGANEAWLWERGGWFMLLLWAGLNYVAPYCAKLAGPCPDDCAGVEVLCGKPGELHGDCWRVKQPSSRDEADNLCPHCGTEEWDHVTAERGRERDVPFNRCNRCEREWGNSTAATDLRGIPALEELRALSAAYNELDLNKYPQLAGWAGRMASRFGLLEAALAALAKDAA